MKKATALLFKPVGRGSISVEQLSSFERKGISLVHSELPVGFQHLTSSGVWPNFLLDKILREKHTLIPVLSFCAFITMPEFS